MCMLVCVHSCKCGLLGRGFGEWVIPYALYMDCTGVDCPPSPSRLQQRERVNLSWSQWWVGKSCQLRVIQSNYPPSVFTNNGFSPPSFFCPAWSLGLHGETASNKAGVGGCQAQASLLSARLLVLEAEGFGGLSVTGCSLTVFWKAGTYCSST